MADLPSATAAAREALENFGGTSELVPQRVLRDILAALDSARGEAVAWRWEEREYNDEWKVRHGEAVPEYENQPRWVRNAAPLCLAPPAAPRVERYGDGVLVHWPEGVEQYVQVGDCVTGNIAAPPAAVPAGYALVPVEPTPEIIAAGWFGGEMHVALGHALPYAEAERDYTAMLAAAARKGE